MTRASTVGTRRRAPAAAWLAPRHLQRGLGILSIAALAALSASLPSAPAEAADAYFKDKQIRLIVGSAPGGGYDAYGRLLAQYMRQHIAGNPTFIVQNMPGAGSLVAANYIYNVAPKDGTFIGAVNAMLATDPLVYPDRVKFDPRQFRWLGSALRENHVGVAWQLTRVKTLDDVLKNELIVAGTGGATNFYPLFVDAILGAKMKMIPGLSGHQAGHAGDGARRGRRRRRHHLGERESHQRRLAARRQDPAVRPVRAEKAPGASRRVLDLRLCPQRRRPRRHGSRLRQFGVRPPLHRAARGAGPSGRYPARRLRGHDERSRVPGRRAKSASSISRSPGEPRSSR